MKSITNKTLLVALLLLGVSFNAVNAADQPLSGFTTSIAQYLMGGAEQIGSLGTMARTYAQSLLPAGTNINDFYNSIVTQTETFLKSASDMGNQTAKDLYNTWLTLKNNPNFSTYMYISIAVIAAIAGSIVMYKKQMTPAIAPVPVTPPSKSPVKTKRRRRAGTAEIL